MASERRRRRLLSELIRPGRWPLRWRLTAVSSVLTFLIIVVFAFVVGRLTAERLEDDFHRELRTTATAIALRTPIDCSTLGAPCEPDPEFLRFIALPNDAVVRFVDAYGNSTIENAPGQTLGAPSTQIERVGPYLVATQPIASPFVDGGPFYVQYARNHDELDATINRLWLFLLGGVLGGTILATLAGLAIAGRAMRPISDLTATAREIATTRDPSQRVPVPRTDDELAELATTFDQMLRELDAARSETEQMVQVQREFVADASHELRTPLTSILANLDLLHERVAGSADDSEIVESALRSSQRMRRLVADLLLLARADAGRLGRKRPCDLKPIVDAATHEVRPVADGHEIVTARNQPVRIEGDPDDLHRLIVNLIDNAVSHTPSGTTIWVSSMRAGDEVVLEVADDGPGIPEGLEEQIFSRFVRAEGKADTSVRSGTGLGLSIVRAVAEWHGGSVVAGRSEHGGALFTVRLPIEQIEGEAEPAESPSEVSAKF